MGVSSRLKGRFRKFLQRPGTTVDLGPFAKRLDAIEAREDALRELDDAALTEAAGAATDYTEICAVGREAARRALAERPFDVQLLGVMALLCTAIGVVFVLIYLAATAVRMHWPSYPLTKGSYACYAPGQWAFWGTEGLPENRDTLHFCGEHTSLDFQGYMEGAAESGERAAAGYEFKHGARFCRTPASCNVRQGRVSFTTKRCRSARSGSSARRSEKWACR